MAWWGRWKATKSRTSFRSQAVSISSASARLMAIGFWQRITLGCRAAAAMVISACWRCQEQTSTKSGRSRSSISR